MSHHIDPMYKLIDTVLQNLGLELIEFYVMDLVVKIFLTISSVAWEHF
jgi:hypothetical protein